jgi:hypothetical protein
MVFVIKIVSKKSLGVKLMFDISIENSTKTIKRLYYYSVTVFDLYLSMIARYNSFLSLKFTMS